MQPQITFPEFVAQMAQIAQLSPPGRTASALARRLGLPEFNAAEIELRARRMRGIFHAMTAWERAHVGQLNDSCRRRIASGAGVPIREVSQLIRQFEIVRELMHRGRSYHWGRRLGAVLGLVRDDSFHRDPSCIYPLTDRQLWQGLRLTIAFVAVCALFVLGYAVFHHG